MKEFARAAGIRALRTVCQTAAGVIASTAFTADGSAAVFITDINWMFVLSASVLAGLVSLLTSVATGLPEVPEAEG